LILKGVRVVGVDLHAPELEGGTWIVQSALEVTAEQLLTAAGGPVDLLVSRASGELLAGQPVTLRVTHRQWHSRLQSSDLSSAGPRYITDVVDVPLSEQTLTSGKEPSHLSLPVPGAGVYVVELESRDRLGRAQVVSIDLYVGGDEPVSWDKPKAGVFTLSPDAKAYDPGQTASIVLQSPFQQAEALVAIETPDGLRYESLAVRGGKAVGILTGRDIRFEKQLSRPVSAVMTTDLVTVREGTLAIGANAPSGADGALGNAARGVNRWP
jgi:uncharacterized protein YfaS (alpha-2-macroglobulin family)